MTRFRMYSVNAQSEGHTIPDRGFHPSASYALGNIETINTTNGNVMLNIPSTEQYNTREFRSPGDNDTRKNSGHFTVHVPVYYRSVTHMRGFIKRVRTPNETAPGPTNGEAHFGEHNPWAGGLTQHAKELTWPF